MPSTSMGTFGGQFGQAGQFADTAAWGASAMSMMGGGSDDPLMSCLMEMASGCYPRFLFCIEMQQQQQCAVAYNNLVTQITGHATMNQYNQGMNGGFNMYGTIGAMMPAMMGGPFPNNMMMMNGAGNQGMATQMFAMQMMVGLTPCRPGSQDAGCRIRKAMDVMKLVFELKYYNIETHFEMDYCNALKELVNKVDDQALNADATAFDHCLNAERDLDETGVDCGGADCGACTTTDAGING
ncbi:TPA: hypothetical protein HA369_00030 [Candidatus Woesearchaeota archaeon]|nr:hypothetical protein [Candidatus Woesearchaeota archaeon]HIJ02682.1 hypothetical protein [Candidatus Woesearchaeota archaeon]